MCPATRLRILDHLKTHEATSVAELARRFSLTGASVRRHLGILERSGLVEVQAVQKEGRGRPRNIYGLARQMRPDGLPWLASALLAELVDPGADEAARRAGLRSVAARLGQDFHAGRGEPLSARLAAVVRFLNRNQYQARWEATSGGARILLGQCPFHSILADHPEVCQLDQQLISGCLGSPVTADRRPADLRAGRAQCVFHLG